MEEFPCAIAHGNFIFLEIFGAEELQRRKKDGIGLGTGKNSPLENARDREKNFCRKEGFSCNVSKYISI